MSTQGDQKWLFALYRQLEPDNTIDLRTLELSQFRILQGSQDLVKKWQITVNMYIPQHADFCSFKIV
jgi:hypothetical protein